MSKQNENARVTVSLTPGEATAFLGKLAYDDDFRQEFVTDPRGTLSNHGIHLPESMIPASVTLPPKEKFASLLATRTEELHSLDLDICLLSQRMHVFMALAIHRMKT